MAKAAAKKTASKKAATKPKATSSRSKKAAARKGAAAPAPPKASIPGGKSKAARQKRLGLLLERLDKVFGEITPPSRDTVPLTIEKAVYLILREGGSATAASKCLESLRGDFVNWNEVRASRPSELSRMMLGTSRAGSLNKMHERSRRVKEMIDQVYNDRNDTDMEFLVELKMKDQIEYLEDLDDLGLHNAYGLVQWMGGDEKLMPVAPAAAKAAQATGILDSAAVAKARKDLADLCPPSRFVALQTHLAQLGELVEDEEVPHSLKEFLV